MGSRGQSVMIVGCVKTTTGSNLVISRFEILSGTDERNRPWNMSASEFTHWLLELPWLTDLNTHSIKNNSVTLSIYLTYDYLSPCQGNYDCNVCCLMNYITLTNRVNGTSMDRSVASLSYSDKFSNSILFLY